MTDARELPYTGGTVDQMRERITQHAYAAQQRFGEFTDRMMDKTREPMSKAEFDDYLTTHHACLYGWATVSLIGFIRDRLGDDAAFSAAAMVDDMGANGGSPYTEDLPYPPASADPNEAVAG